jgi:hypothetical protein
MFQILQKHLRYQGKNYWNKKSLFKAAITRARSLYSKAENQMECITNLSTIVNKLNVESDDPKQLT